MGDNANWVIFAQTADVLARRAAEAAAPERAPLAPQRVFELPPPTPEERREADALLAERTGLAAPRAAADRAVLMIDQLLVRLNTTPRSALASGVVVHHPAEDLKKLAHGPPQGYRAWEVGFGTLEGSSRIRHAPDVRSEGGSSGAAIWKRVDGSDYLAGVLTGGAGAARTATSTSAASTRATPR